MMDSNEKRKVEIIVKLSRSYNLVLLLVFLLLLIFVLNQQTRRNDCGQANQPISEKNLFKCYESAKNMSNYFKTFGVSKPSLASLHDYLMRLDSRTNFEISNQKWLVDQYFNDFKANRNKIQYISNSKIETIQQSIVNNLNYNPVDDVYLEKMFRKHLNKQSLQINRRIGILSWFEKDYWPWIESLLLLSGAENVVDLDFSKKSYESTHIKSVDLNQYLENRLDSYRNSIDTLNEYQFDVLISHFSVESIGLGKYGEDISFDADLDTLNILNCMLRNEGLLFIYLTVDETLEKSSIEFNTKRVYGKTRLQEFFFHSQSNWFLIDRMPLKHGREQLYVLKKRFNI